MSVLSRVILLFSPHLPPLVPPMLLKDLSILVEHLTASLSYSQVFLQSISMLCVKYLLYAFIYFWLHLVFVAVHGFSLVAESTGYSGCGA